MKFSAQQIADLIGGKIEGDAAITVNRLSKIEDGGVESLSFLSNLLYAPYLYETDASVVIIPTSYVLEKKIKAGCTLIRVDDPRMGFAVLLDAYNKLKGAKVGIDSQAFIDPSAKIGTNCYVGAFTYIGKNAVIGDNVKLYPNVYIGDYAVVGNDSTLYPGVKVYHECIIGKNCILQASVVIGGDGFGFQPNSENNYNKIPHIGNVILEDYVEIGANTTIDRATLGSTLIKKGVKLDNLIQIGHNVEIGENTVIASLTGVSGSTKIGKNCMIGGQVGFVGHLTIADEVKIAAQSGVGQSITVKGETVQGSPAFAIGQYRRSYVGFKSLPELTKKIDRLEKKLEELRLQQLSLNDSKNI